MSSGEFAHASGLSRKALRLYDELGLLTPVRVDPRGAPDHPGSHARAVAARRGQDHRGRGTDPEQTAADLIALAIDRGAPDNVTCIVADIVTATKPTEAQAAKTR